MCDAAPSCTTPDCTVGRIEGNPFGPESRNTVAHYHSASLKIGLEPPRFVNSLFAQPVYSSTVLLSISYSRHIFSGMQDVIGSLSGFRGVRADLLVTLKKEQPLTATELAAHFGLTPNALRRHLKVLEEDGLVRHQREVRGVGAPVFAYRLTEAGESVFPRRYASVLVTALQALQEEHGDQSVARVLEREWDALAADAGPVLDELPLAERVQLVAELMTARGYMAEGVGSEGEGATLRIHNCAMCEIAEQFPEACEVEARQLTRLLGAPVARRSHRFAGGTACAYEVGGDEVVAVQSQLSDNPSVAAAPASAAHGPTASGLPAWDEEQA